MISAVTPQSSHIPFHPFQVASPTKVASDAVPSTSSSGTSSPSRSTSPPSHSTSPPSTSPPSPSTSPLSRSTTDLLSCFKHDIDASHWGSCTTVIFDLGDVLFTWSANTKTCITPSVLKKILRSSTWFEYEKGNLTEEGAYSAVAEEFSVPASEVRNAFQDARDSLQRDPVFLSLIKELKEEHGVTVFAMSNISAPDWEVLKGKATPEEWSLFDRVFTSAEARERKPNLGFFHHVLEATGVDPQRTIFVDDKFENVLSARSLGIKGIVYDPKSFEMVARQLRNCFADPVSRAQVWLNQHAGKLISVTNTDVVLRENFAQLLILEATHDRSLVDYVQHPRLYNFFQGPGVLTTAEFPCDLDTTSIALTVTTHIDHHTTMGILDEMLTYMNKDGIIQTYFDVTRPRIDPIVCVNVLTLFHTHGRGHELAATLDWVYSILKHRAYIDGTLYYHGGDAFLFFLSRLLSISPVVYARFASLFSHRYLERIGTKGDAQALAMRIIAGTRVGIANRIDLERLLESQEEDGGFPMGWMYKYGGSGIMIGNKGLTTGLAKQAIEAVRELDARSI